MHPPFGSYPSGPVPPPPLPPPASSVVQPPRSMHPQSSLSSASSMFTPGGVTYPGQTPGAGMGGWPPKSGPTDPQSYFTQPNQPAMYQPR
ncbi:unnamed protein product [Echinostoma caproni]|uniref:Protein transport protein Sec24D n=1 Tax=Echinostoma caproni TaxID=27848 RepID=A0A183AVW8_9TREM|nr:unnamed protein product [Echinostoma caproni]